MRPTPGSRSWSGVTAWLLGFLACLPALGGSSSWTSAGPDGASVTALVAVPSSSTDLLAATQDGGILRSSDGGSSWVSLRVHPGPNPLGALAISAAAPNTVYGYTGDPQLGNLLVRSGDAGSHWRQLTLSLGANNYPISLAVDPTNASAVYLGTADGVFRSTDAGLTFSTANSGIPPGRYVSALAIDPTNANTVYAATSGGIYKSTDGAQSWSPSGFLGKYMFCVAIDPGKTSTIYSAASGEGMFRTTDSGQTWTRINIGLGDISETGAYLIVVDPMDSSTIYAETYGGDIRSTDAGATWTHLKIGPAPKQNLSAGALALIGSPSAVVAASLDGLLRSTDKGENWSPATGLRASTIAALALNPSAPQSIFAGGPGGVFRSTNSGGEWSEKDLAAPPASALVVDPGESSNVYAGDVGGVWKSTDGGHSWSATGQLDTGQVSSLAIDSSGSILYAGSASVYSLSGGISKTTDGGQSWQRLAGIGQARAIYTLLIDPHEPQTIYAGSDFTVYDYPSYPSGGGVLRTTDGGQTWSLSSTDLQSPVRALAGDPSRPSTLYAGTAANGVYKSMDGGTSWSSAGHGIPDNASPLALVVDPASPATVYAGTSTGVYRSIDGGSSWQFFGNGLGDVGVNALALDATGRLLHAATAGGGVFERSIASNRLPCEPGDDHLCLLGNRFRVDLTAIDPRTGVRTTGQANAQADRFGYFGLSQLTGDPTLPEVFVKMVDATSLPGGGVWVFFSGLTDLHYALTVSDTLTGRSRDYESEGLCGAADTLTFSSGAASAVRGSERTRPWIALADSADELTLLGRFHLTLSATDPRTGRISAGTAIPQGDRFGYFSLPAFTGDPNFPEVFVKMIDATSLPGGTFWLFHTGLTDLSYVLTVTDGVTHAVKEYRNDPTDPTRLCGEADTAAFAGP